MTIVSELQDYRYLNWTHNRNSSGTAGSLLKAYEGQGEGRIYYKLSSYDPVLGIVGHECVNELIADRLLTVLHIEHLSYSLIHALVHVDGRDMETYMCASRNFRQRGESKMAMDVFYQMNRLDGETPPDFCKRYGWERYIYQMIFIDYLILNRDRHGANMEVLQDSHARTIRLAPLFDHGLSLLCSCLTPAEIHDFDVMKDRPVQTFIGGRSVYDNLRFIPPGYEIAVEKLTPEDRDFILDGLSGILSEEHLSRIWEMIWGRWKQYEDLRNS